MKVILILCLFATFAEFITSLRPLTSNATELAKAMKLGWNIGNTLEAIGGETYWGNPQVTKQLIDLVKSKGFNSIRIPCSWNQYIEDRSTNKIKAQWLARVKEVVQMCVDNGLYVLLNIHWDQGWLENNCTPDMQKSVNAKQKQLWSQIAKYFKDFDNHLLFASANEPVVKDEKQMAVLLSYHQTFVNVVRASGGRNRRRVLVVQGPETNTQLTYDLMRKLPMDIERGRLMVEVHYYAPFQFCLMDQDASWGKMSYYWGQNNLSPTETDRNSKFGEADIDKDFGLMKKGFADRGIPVILGEFSAKSRDSVPAKDRHQASRKAWTSYVVKSSRKNGMIPFYWDTGLFNRAAAQVNPAEAHILEALVNA